MNEPQTANAAAGPRAEEAVTVRLELPLPLLDEVNRVAENRGCSRDDALLHVLAMGLEQLRSNGASPARRQAPYPARAAVQAAWRAVAPANSDRPLASHEWAENLLPTLPLRFQKYIAELLFDDERILYFLHRLPFRTAARLPWRRQRVHEGLLLITDRMVMMIEDAIPPGPMFMDWGYDAWMTAIERVSGTQLSDDGARLRIGCLARDGREEHVIPFEPSQRADLADALALLNRYGGAGERLPRRTYHADIPSWEPPDARAARGRIAGRGIDEVEERELEIAEAGGEPGAARLRGAVLEIDGRRDRSVQVASISSICIWRAVTGCSLDVHVPKGGSVGSRSIVFQYPQSTPFLRIASRLRHLMGRAIGDSQRR
jgi:hypothetical protein